MKYTNSQDGVERCTVLLEMRLTREEYKEIAALAKAMKRKSVKDYLEYTMLDGERLYSEMEEDKRQLRYETEEEGKTYFVVS